MGGVLFIVAAAFLGLGLMFARGPRQGKVSKAVGWTCYLIAALSVVLALVG